ncbi:MAG TPA: type VI secretion system baseplate subunit TssG [Bryobacteraceae bacterium]|nr:type VI secretion system baseplate subunit TssG [Bryobacteraceae bacterium]
MAAASGEPGAAVTLSRQPGLRRLLEDQPYAVEFYQAVQLLERIFPERAPVGHFAPPEEELVRFSVHTQTSFPASEIQFMDWPQGRAPVMGVNFLGLIGPSGVLPRVYSTLVLERLAVKDRTLLDFLDLFHHRLISLFYRVWRKYHIPGSIGTTDDRVTGYVRGLVGINTPGLRNRQDVPDESLLFYAGLLGLQPRSAVALEHMLRDYFRAPVRVLQFVGAWYDLPRRAQCEMIAEERNSRQLGMGAVAGDQVFGHASKARLRFGPLSLDRYRQFLPGESGFRALRALARFYSGGQIDFDVQLVLARDDVPEYELGGDGAAALPLGLCSWAKTTPFQADPDDAIFDLGGDE